MIGLVGRSSAGKTHLLSALIKSLDEMSEVAEFGIVGCTPIDGPRHREIMTERVDALYVDRNVIPATHEGVTMFADAFVVAAEYHGVRTSRVVALFDVAGGDLQKVVDHREFLYVADGLLFVADPEALDAHEDLAKGDTAFGAVLELLGRGPNRNVAAALAVSKADLIRFHEPVDYWMRQPVSLNREALLSETRDMFAYIHSRGGHSWLRPVRELSDVTIHAVSATGCGSVVANGIDIFSRPPRRERVLGPLLSLLEKTGVLRREAF